MEDIGVILERHEQQIKALKKDMSDLHGVQSEIRSMHETLVVLATELKHTNEPKELSYHGKSSTRKNYDCKLWIYPRKCDIMKKNTIRSKQMDLWKMLAATEKTVVMYGMGNGADKILAVCEKYGVTVADFFASDGFVRGQSFHGKVVLSFSDVKEKYGAENIIVLVSFASSLPDVMAQIGAVAAECETYVPDVPVRGETLFCEEYYEENREDIEKALSLLADERSREVFSGVLEFRRTGSLDVLLQTADDRADVMREMLDLDTYRVAVDLGAYDGDTARELTELCPNIEKIVAFEPDRRNYRKLSAYAEIEPRVDAINAAAWSENGVICFDDSGNRNAGLYEEGAKRRAEVKALTVDGVCANEAVDFIKYDVEGSEREAIEGSADTIRRHRPDLLISLYHRTEDLHELILQIHALCPEYKLYVRRYPYIPAWDLNLYATVK